MIRKAYTGDVVPGQDLRGFLACPYCHGSIQWQKLETGGICKLGARLEGWCSCGYMWHAEIIKARIYGAGRPPPGPTEKPDYSWAA